MRHWIDGVARLATAALLAAGMLVLPGGPSPVSVTRAADCPPPPVTIAKLVHLDAPGQRCYGARLLVFRAFVAPPCDGCGGVAATRTAPLWLDRLDGNVVGLSAVKEGPQESLFVPAKLGRCRLDDDAGCPLHAYRGGWATISARYDAPVAQTCRYSFKPAGGGYTKADAVAGCEANLVFVAVGPDSGPPTDTVADVAAATPTADARGGPGAAWVALFATSVIVSGWLLAHRRRSWTRGPSRG
jgi:hypothetical protein